MAKKSGIQIGHVGEVQGNGTGTLHQIIEPTQAHDPANTSAGCPIASVTTMAVPWTGPVPAAVKGVIHVPAHNTPIKVSRREALLIAIATARQWIDDLAHGAPPASP